MAQDPLSALNARLPSPVEKVHDALLDEAGVLLYLKRDDLIHDEVPGNKWRKLKYNLATARDNGRTTLLTFGGAYSNHLRAVSAAGKYCGFRTVGVVRGEQHTPLNWSLEIASRNGMELTYLDRTTYRNKTDPRLLEDLRQRFGNFYFVPEGGSNALALKGCAELPREIDEDFDLICCPCGTGGTLAGIAVGLTGKQQALGFSALKGGKFLNDDVAALQRAAYGDVTNNWSINLDFHFGGYAKRKHGLDDFINSFHERHGVRLEWVYVAKMLYGILTLVEEGYFQRGSKIVAVITGSAEPNGT